MYRIGTEIGKVNGKEMKHMSEKEKNILYDLARKLPAMTEHERGYLEGTLATAAAMSEKSKKDKEVSESQKAG